jgi:hypothetical protein
MYVVAVLGCMHGLNVCQAATLANPCLALALLEAQQHQTPSQPMEGTQCP